MVIKLQEVYRSSTSTSRGSPTDRMRWKVREIFVNPEHIVYARPSAEMSMRLTEGLIDGVSSDQRGFCILSLNRGNSGTDITVVGTLEEIENRISKERQILYG